MKTRLTRPEDMMTYDFSMTDAAIMMFEDRLKRENKGEDIWPKITEDNLVEIKRLHNKFKSKLNRSNENAWMNSWMKEYLQHQRRRNRSYNC